ncbi:hypothetical protein Misp01_27610 [Microtetraspora sp. NBRC 13810]|nr:hypothetical protein Misp01_27610 [Microtetraspora sp. NBRC 13810]
MKTRARCEEGGIERSFVSVRGIPSWRARCGPLGPGGTLCAHDGMTDAFTRRPPKVEFR